MAVTIPDEILREARLSDREALIEIACRLFQAGKLGLWPAAKLAELTRNGFEDELLERDIPVYRYSAKQLAQDLDVVKGVER